MATARYSFSAVGLEDKLYAIGGTIQGDRCVASVEIYTCQNHRWESLPSMRCARSGHQLAVLDGKLYIVGGEELEEDECFSACEVYDPVQNIWNDFAPLDAYFSNGVIALLSWESKLWAIHFGGQTRIYDPIFDLWSKGPDLPLPEGEYTGDCDSGGHVAAVFQSTQTLKSVDASC